MNWELLGSARVPDSNSELKLYRRREDFSLRLDNLELMNSRVHGSEEALARLACGVLRQLRTASVLVGGLGMGFTLRALLDELGPGCRVTVAELMPAVIGWNEDFLGQLADFPLRDPRVTVVTGDVAKALEQKNCFDAILLDVDNGPEGLTHADNAQLYGLPGLARAFSSLKPGGVLALWSAHQSDAFRARLVTTGFRVEEKRVRERGTRGARHTIWLAVKP